MQTLLLLTDTTSLEDRTLFSALYARLPEYRQKKVAALRPESGKRLSLAAGALLAEGLRRAGLSPTEEIAQTELGKPYLPAHPELHFSLSHSGTLALCALSPFDIGCDIEQQREILPGVAERWFTADELAVLNAEPDGARRTELFFRIWTLRESFLKVTGQGFSLPRHAFSIAPAESGYRFAQTFDARAYRFFEPAVAAGYACACALADAPAELPPPAAERIEPEKLYDYG